MREAYTFASAVAIPDSAGNAEALFALTNRASQCKQ